MISIPFEFENGYWKLLSPKIMEQESVDIFGSL
jgi:hypothetical protein